jgi:parallel beta-helix repeat protein
LKDADAHIKENLFQNQVTGIAKTNTSTGSGITKIVGNTFQNNTFSIDLHESDMTVIEDNHFELTSPVGLQAFSAGIYVEASNLLNIVNNEFSSDTEEDVFFIICDQTGDALQSTIRNNYFGKSNLPAYRHIELHGANDKLLLPCNYFNFSGGSSIDFGVGLESGASLMDQGSRQMPSGNDWSTLGSCEFTNDESHIHKHNLASGFVYYSHDNKAPDCISTGVNVFPTGGSQPSTYCDLPTSTPCRFCPVEVIKELHDVRQDFPLNPPFGWTLTQIQSHLDVLQHVQQEIVTKHFVELFFNDTLQYALDFLDSVIQYVPEMDSLHDALLSKYEAMSLMSVHYEDGQGNPNKSYIGLTSFDTKSIEGFIKRDRIAPLKIQLDNQAEIDHEVKTPESLFNIRPNPASSFVEIELNSKKINKRSDYRIEIINAEGKRVYHSMTRIW